MFEIPWGFPYQIECRPPRVLLVSASHGFPPTQARFTRAAELARELTRRSAIVDWVVLVERRLQYAEEDLLVSMRTRVQGLHVVDHPRLDSPWRHKVSRSLAWLPWVGDLGGSRHAPGRLARFLRSGLVPRQPDIVLVSGVHLARLLRSFPQGTLKILDVPRLGSAVHRSHAEAGRAEELAVFHDASREARLLRAADTVLVTSQADAVLVRLGGHSGNLILAPPTGWLPEGSPAISASRAPESSPRLLFVGSETTANLDAVRWFRQSVLPRVIQAVPSCRLRIVGEVARHVDPDPFTERFGWVDSLETEYQDAAAVVLPLRMGSGVRRRAVEALVRGKALCATRTGGYGLRLVSGRQALLADDADEMAAGLVQILESESFRHGLEDGALVFASTHLDRDRSYVPLGEYLGLPEPEDDDVSLTTLSAVDTPAT